MCVREVLSIDRPAIDSSAPAGTRSLNDRPPVPIRWIQTLLPQTADPRSVLFWGHLRGGEAGGGAFTRPSLPALLVDQGPSIHPSNSVFAVCRL